MSLFAIGFGAAGMLGGLGLATLPVVIHLLHRRRHRETDWAAMEWLLIAIRKRSRNLRLEQLLLLAVRTLAIAAVVLAMSQPLLDAVGLGGLGLLGRGNTHTTFVIDNSLSMLYADAGGSRIDRAKQAAKKILDGAARGDTACVVVLTDTPTAVVKEPSPNLAEVLREIDGLRPYHGGAKLEGAVDLVAATLRAAGGRKRVVLLTDMQRSFWNASEGGDLGKRLLDLGNAADFSIVDVGSAVAPNAAVLDLEQADPVAIVGRPTLFRATLAHFADDPKPGQLVELLVNGQVEASQRLDLPAHGETVVAAFSHALRDAEDAAVEVRIPDDGLAADNRRGLAAPARGALRVLLVDGQPSGEPFRSETDYLRVALSAEDNGPFVPIVKTEAELLEGKLDQWDAALLCNVAAVTPTEAAALRDALKRGGAIGFILGSQTNLGEWNRTLFDEGKGILPERLADLIGDPAQRETAARFDPLGYKHALVKPFAGNENAGLLTARTHRYVKLELPKGEGAAKRPVEVALAFRGGDPAVVFADVERGRVAVVATGADLDWNRWPLSPSYLPAMQGLVKELVARRFRRASAIVGEPLDLALPAGMFDVTATVTPPGGGPLPAKSEDRDGVSHIRYDGTELSGFYAVEAPNFRAKLAVNPPKSESDLARLSADDLKAQFPGWNFTLGEPNAAAPVAEASSQTPSWHRPLLWGALALLFLETFLAWRAAHHGS